MGYTSAVRKCIHIEIKTRFNLIHEKEWTGGTISIICKRYGVSRKTYISGIRDTNRKGQKVYQITQEDLIISSTRR